MRENASEELLNDKLTAYRRGRDATAEEIVDGDYLIAFFILVITSGGIVFML